MFSAIGNCADSLCGLIFLILLAVLLLPITILVLIVWGIVALVGCCVGDRNNVNGNLNSLLLNPKNDLSLDNSRLTNLAEMMQKLNSQEVEMSKSEKKELKNTITHELKELQKEVKDKFTKDEMKTIKKEAKHALKEVMKELPKHKTHLFSHNKPKNFSIPPQRVVLSPSM